MATCNICKYAGTPSYKSPCSECKGFSKYEYKKPQTNADRIRAMSDEELAEQLVSYRGGAYDDYITHAGAFYEWEDAVEAEAQWLKQPAEDQL